LTSCEDLLRHQFAGGGRAVGQEDGDSRPARLRLSAERLFQRPADIGAAPGYHALDEILGSGQRLFGTGDRLIAEADYFGAECDHIEAVARVDLSEAVLDGQSGLFDLLAAHRSARIEHENHVLVDHGLFLGAAGRIAQQHEVAVVVPFGPIRQHPQSQVVLVGDPTEAEIVLARVIVGLDANGRLVKALALDGGLVRGTEQGAERNPVPAADGDGHRQPGDRSVGIRRGGHRTLEHPDARVVPNLLLELHHHLDLVLQLERGYQQRRPAAVGEDAHRVELFGQRLVDPLGRVRVEEPGARQDRVVPVGNAGGDDHALPGRPHGQRHQAYRLHRLLRPGDRLLDLGDREAVVDRRGDRAVTDRVKGLLDVLVADESAVLQLSGEENRPGLDGRRHERQQTGEDQRRGRQAAAMT